MYCSYMMKKCVSSWMQRRWFRWLVLESISKRKGTRFHTSLGYLVSLTNKIGMRVKLVYGMTKFWFGVYDGRYLFCLMNKRSFQPTLSYSRITYFLGSDRWLCRHAKNDMCLVTSTYTFLLKLNFHNDLSSHSVDLILFLIWVSVTPYKVVVFS